MIVSVCFIVVTRWSCSDSFAGVVVWDILQSVIFSSKVLYYGGAFRISCLDL